MKKKCLSCGGKAQKGAFIRATGATKKAPPKPPTKTKTNRKSTKSPTSVKGFVPYSK